MNSFLENFLGRDRDLPKVALYRLWLGTSVDKLKCLTRAVGDGTWGQLEGAYFLAEGSPDSLAATFARLEKEYSKPIYGVKGQSLAPIPDAPPPTAVVAALAKLPRAAKVKGN
ncbi:MAG: hypothetical protein HY248_03125 [Fimbriimonas ginsengisoli]|nr:hypothetical protein [Fimbriimonas ginsengisoli]